MQTISSPKRMIMKIFFARHGDYQNPDNIAPCRLPGFPLSIIGIEQVKLTASKLEDQKIRAIFTSPITRCVQTATIIGQSLHLYPNQKEQLIELGSPFQGYKNIDIPKDLYLDPIHVSGGGETREAIFTRVNNFVENLKQTSKNSNYLLVSHGDPIMIYLKKTLQKELRYIPMGGLVMLDYSQSGIPKYTEII